VGAASTSSTVSSSAAAGTTERHAAYSRGSCGGALWRPRSAACASAPPPGQTTAPFARAWRHPRGCDENWPTTRPRAYEDPGDTLPVGAPEAELGEARPQLGGKPARTYRLLGGMDLRQRDGHLGVPPACRAPAAARRRGGSLRSAFAVSPAKCPKARAWLRAALTLPARIAPSDRPRATAAAFASAHARASADSSLSSASAAEESSPAPGEIGCEPGLQHLHSAPVAGVGAARAEALARQRGQGRNRPDGDERVRQAGRRGRLGRRAREAVANGASALKRSSSTRPKELFSWSSLVGCGPQQ
jgi:hypothetical protein